MSEIESLHGNGEADVNWLAETLCLEQMLLRRLHGLKKYLSRRGISSVQTQTNGNFFDVALSAERLYASRRARRAAAFFWGLRQNRFISELTGGAVFVSVAESTIGS
jgi:hypothetical protein